MPNNKPNLIFVFSDQHRAQATGYAGNLDVKTPNLDRLFRESISFTTAVSGTPVCSPYRASLITGQYPLTHGIFVNDVSLNTTAPTVAEVLSENGYYTAYIGKWHIDGRGRSSFIPKERRYGFDFWQVLECTHNYNGSFYYDDHPEKKLWDGYDAAAQTQSAINYIKKRDRNKPFCLFLSWGPPHDPYGTAPGPYKNLYQPEKLTLRPNVPPEVQDKARLDLAGYYAHVSALDHLCGTLLETVQEGGIEEDTIFIYTSDHGDMLGSHGQQRKQRPWDESILVPFLLRYPRLFGRKGREVSMPINAPDIMPTLLGLCNAPIPSSVEGVNYTPYLKGDSELSVEAALISCIHPFGEFNKGKGGREYRGIRTRQYTYVRDLTGPWLLYDNYADPYQINNLCNLHEHKNLQESLEGILKDILALHEDDFLQGEEYIKRWGYITDETGTVPYTK